MAYINKCEDIIAWQRARELASIIWGLISEGSFAKDHALCDQINRSSGSVMDNLAEGFGRGDNKEFIQFLLIAKGSLDEVKSQLYRASDRKHISQETFNTILSKTLELNNIIGGLIKYLKNSDIKGYKFKESSSIIKL